MGQKGGGRERSFQEQHFCPQFSPIPTQHYTKKHQSLAHAAGLTGFYTVESQDYREMWPWDLLALIPAQRVFQAGTEEEGQRPWAKVCRPQGRGAVMLGAWLAEGKQTLSFEMMGSFCPWPRFPHLHSGAHTAFH